ncbi:methyltransferase domain-containing protein [Streptomyces flavofungini]|uniref:Protein-L-isoaspartate O-methyltransferase n=1 Tax=Streptomyces flavofungini TaxID=68200 RepID=A0ABS0XIS3_9ACTN|nr:methyltransferase domain-containing protein [Streptomyces flavofungini]MBJ3813130.1 methyltransferase domain-containing protein [Streptomyces flavofungini]GHC89432.1 protein-L-isoaspartate O-methyltransferase [Streptomyces flavofungini]
MSEHLASALAAHLAASGNLTAPWHEHYTVVPRHHFIPDVAWVVPDETGAEPYAIDRNQDTPRWFQAVYSDASIVIQLDAGTGDLRTGKGTPTSSCSAPGIVFPMLRALDLLDGHKVLEIGTGSGWTAALLSARLGSHRVTSIEVDEDVAARAAEAMARAGYTPQLITADGADGYTPNAPYDRVHATCAVERVPYAWVRDTRPGGVIVLPWRPTYGHGLLARLVVNNNGQAIGRFERTASFMMLRTQQRAIGWTPHDAEDATAELTTLDPRTIINAPEGAALAIAALAPGVTQTVITEPGGDVSLLLSQADTPEGAWAAVDYSAGLDAYTVTWWGDHNLWAQVSDAYLQWVSWGQPARTRFGITVTPEDQVLWLDHPRHRVPPYA